MASTILKNLARFRHPIIFAGCALALVLAPNTLRAKNPSPCAADLSSCPIAGCSSSASAFAPFDPDLNEQKNHTFGPPDQNAMEHPRGVEAMMSLPVHKPKKPNGKDIRSSWHTPDDPIGKIEGHQASIVGYVLRVRRGGPESCNCDLVGDDQVDTHLNIVGEIPDPNIPAKDLAGASAIVEVTWRLRNDHHSDWTYDALSELSVTYGEGPQVRITGDLLYDNVHWDMKNKGQRGTLWEIHPIRAIDVLINDHWVPFHPGPNSVFALAMNPNRQRVLHERHLLAQPLRLTRPANTRWTPTQIRALDAALGEDHS